MLRRLILTVLATFALAVPVTPSTAAAPVQAAAAVPCTNGMAGNYPCRNIDLQSNLPLSAMGGGSGSGGWGWTDSTTGKEYAIVARTNGTSFVDISTPTSPVYLGNLPTATGSSSWRELTVHNNTAYIVSDNNGSHGLQVFDLTRLRAVTSPPVTFSADARDTAFSRAHTVSVNAQTGFLYVNGSTTCSGGPRAYSLANRLSPTFVGCISGDGYSHDSTAVVYRGPDTRYQGKEILAGANEDTLTFFDVTSKSSPVQLSRKTYTGRGYVHQGVFTEDHKYFLLDDETDETSNGGNTRTYVWNVADLTNPVHVGTFNGPTTASDHNQWIKGNYSYQSNYKAGLRVVELTNVATPAAMSEAAYFDIYPSSNTAGFNGTWTNYPYYPSGNVAVFTIEGGLFVVKPNLSAPSNDFAIGTSPSSGSTNPGSSVTTTVNTSVRSGSAETVTLTASGLPTGATASFSPSSVTAGNSSTLTVSTAVSTPPGTYSVTVTGTAPSATHTATYTLTVNSAGCSAATNPTDVAIQDNSTAESPVTISGCSGSGSATSSVAVNIVHTYIGDLIVDLIAPDGSAYNLHNRSGGSTDNINQTYTVNLSSEPRNGAWKLRVQDRANADTGYINSWTITP